MILVTVQRDLQNDLTAYFTPADFAGKKILDFGCGSGASSMILARMFPQAQIVGIELEEKLLRIARARLEFYQYPNIEFVLSPSGNKLPAEIGEFEFVIMSAVYEHLLPIERKTGDAPSMVGNKTGRLFIFEYDLAPLVPDSTSRHRLTIVKLFAR